jgi:hypothetical protein
MPMHASSRRFAGLILYQQGHKFRDTPNMVAETRFHRWGDAQCLVNANVVAVHEMKGH